MGMRKFRPYKKKDKTSESKVFVLLSAHKRVEALVEESYRLQDPVKATHPLDHPGLLLRHKQHHGVHGQAGGPPPLGRRHPQAGHGPLRVHRGQETTQVSSSAPVTATVWCLDSKKNNTYNAIRLLFPGGNASWSRCKVYSCKLNLDIKCDRIK